MSYAEIVLKNIKENDPKSVAPSPPKVRASPRSIRKQEKEDKVRKEAREKDANKRPVDLKKVPYTDFGVNLTHKTFSRHVDRLLDDSLRFNVEHLVCIGSSVVDSVRTAALIRKHAAHPVKLSMTAGVHPHSATRCLKDPEWKSKLVKIINENKDIVVAIGECGLDYDRMFSTAEDQKAVFKAQLELASELGLPVYLHEREAYEDFYDILEEHVDTHGSIRGIVHCFTGAWDKIQDYMGLGLYLGITGYLCDRQRNETLYYNFSHGHIPLDRILIETDAPYLIPKDLERRPQHNGPRYLPHIAKWVAWFYKLKPREFAIQMQKNEAAFFGVAKDAEVTPNQPPMNRLGQSTWH